MCKRYAVAFIILLFSTLCYAQTDQAAMTIDGRQVILKSDKTWFYLDEQQDSKSVRSTPIVGDNISEIRQLVASISPDLAQSDSETISGYAARLKKLLGEKRLTASDHTLYQSVIVIDNLDLDYNSLTSTFEIRVVPSNAIDSSGVRLVQRSEGQWKQFRAYQILFPMSADVAPRARPNIRLAIYGFPVQVSEDRLLFVPTKYVVFNEKTGKRYMSFPEANLMVGR